MNYETQKESLQAPVNEQGYEQLSASILASAHTDSKVSKRPTVVIINDDCRSAFTALKPHLGGFFKAAITSPPYFGLRNNGYGEEQIGLGFFAEYIAAMLQVCVGLNQLTRKDALLWLQIGDKWAGGGNGRPGKNAQVAKATLSRDVAGQFEILPAGYKPREQMDLPGICKESAKRANWMPINRIIWYKGKSLPCAKDRLGDAYEHILLLSKGRHWNLYKDELPEDLSYCRENVWFIPPNKNDTANLFGVDHSSTFPPELAGCCSILSARPGEWIIDPFGGLGNTAMGALRFGINTVLIEQNSDYASAAAERFRNLPDSHRPDIKILSPHK